MPSISRPENTITIYFCRYAVDNGDAFAALSQEFERSATRLAEEWAQTSALAKIAVLGESANEAVEESGEEVAE